MAAEAEEPFNVLVDLTMTLYIRSRQSGHCTVLKINELFL
jgi:hypothetical protein